VSDLPYLQSELVVGLVGLDPTGASTIAVGATASGLQVAIVDTSGNGTITALGQSVTASTSGYSTVIFTLTGTWTATIFIEGFDGTQWFTTQGVLEPVSILLTNLIDNQTVSVNCGGMQKVRLRSTAFSSGTVNISWNAGPGVNSVWAYNYNPGTLNATVVPTGITKGTQNSVGFTVQNLKDAGRVVTNYFMALPIITTATDTLQALTGYKNSVAVAATTTPAVVTAGKIYRISTITLTYVGVATLGSAKFTLRANTGGLVALGSPAVSSWVIGAGAAVAGSSGVVSIPIPDGIIFSAGTGIGVSVVGLSTTQTQAAVGYAQISICGFEY
jgi:hypothetical protein